jgi:hypothetical protein
MRTGLFIISTMVGLCVAVPAIAQGIDVRIGHRDHDRGGRGHGESRTVVIRRDHDRDRGWHRGFDRDHDRGVHRKVIIDR